MSGLDTKEKVSGLDMQHYRVKDVTAHMICNNLYYCNVASQDLTPMTMCYFMTPMTMLYDTYDYVLLYRCL